MTLFIEQTGEKTINQSLEVTRYSVREKKFIVHQPSILVVYESEAIMFKANHDCIRKPSEDILRFAIGTQAPQKALLISDPHEDWSRGTNKGDVSGLENELNELMGKYNYLVDRINGFKKLEKNWDTFDNIPPSQIAIDNALIALNKLKYGGILPSQINPSSDGIVFNIFYNNKYYVFDFDNEGEIVFLKSDPNSGREVYDIEKSDIDKKITELI